jgi:hypothetical protein
MLMRAAVLYVLFVVASMATAVAVWQTGELRLRDSRLAESIKTEELLQRKLQVAVAQSLSSGRRARLAVSAAEDLRKSRSGENDEIAVLTAKLAAARQQTTVAEIAMTEAEDRLAEEIAAHAKLKAEVATMQEAAKTVSMDTPQAMSAVQPLHAVTESNLTVGHIETPGPVPAGAVDQALATNAGTNVGVETPPSDATHAAELDPTKTAEPVPTGGATAGSTAKNLKVATPAPAIRESNGGVRDIAQKPDDKKSVDGNAVNKRAKSKKITNRSTVNKSTSGAAPFAPLF